MTSRNLNRTWFGTLKKQYQADYEADVAFPIRYLLWNPLYKRDLYYEIPTKIPPKEFRRSIGQFLKATSDRVDPTYSSENLKVHARTSQAASTGVEYHPEDAEDGNHNGDDFHD